MNTFFCRKFTFTMDLDMDMSSYSGSDNNFVQHHQLGLERKHKSQDHARLVSNKKDLFFKINLFIKFQVPEKRVRFERTADMLAKSGLLDITMKTAELLRSNQQARQDLVTLKQEIDQFMESVLANPENQVNIHRNNLLIKRYLLVF